MTNNYYLILENNNKTYELNSDFEFTDRLIDPYYFTNEDYAIDEAKSQMKKIRQNDFYVGEVKIEVIQTDDENLDSQEIIFTILKSQETKQELFNRILNNFEDKDFIDELSGFDIIDSVEKHKKNYGNCEDQTERDILEEAINYYFDENCEIIYHDNAMKYLTENDNSLQNSLQLASDMGFDLKSLNSGILASILLADDCKSFTSDFIAELEEEGFFDTEE